MRFVCDNISLFSPFFILYYGIAKQAQKSKICLTQIKLSTYLSIIKRDWNNVKPIDKIYSKYSSDWLWLSSTGSWWLICYLSKFSRYLDFDNLIILSNSVQICAIKLKKKKLRHKIKSNEHSNWNADMQKMFLEENTCIRIFIYRICIWVL